MFDKKLLNNAIAEYKQNFAATDWWNNEKFKWEAIKHFKDNWDVNAVDFADMLSRAFAKTYGLLVNQNNFPKRMIQLLAQKAPEEVRAMFIALFDESMDVVERIENFKTTASIVLEKHGDGAGQHYQHENAISIYLWLRYPDKYYIYKYGEIKGVSDKLNSDYRFKKGAYSNNIRNCIHLCNEIRSELRKDTELVKLFKSRLSDACYPDPELITLAIDVVFYISRIYSEKWFPTDYSPGLSVDKWVELLKDNTVFNTGSLEIMKRMKDHGGMATCTQLSMKYGQAKNFYNSGSVGLARRVAEKTGCPVMPQETENARWWPILYVGRWADKDDTGSYIWKLREELSQALDKVDLSHIELYAYPNPDPVPVKPQKYSKTDFLNEVYMTESRYDRLVSVLQNKKNIILKGAPGVGKTFAAKRLAYSIMGEKDEDRIEFVQFHQNYSYEDFLMGYKPVEDGFELKYGIFHQFCQKAAKNPDKDYFFIIDEINRGNLSKIFGELLMLIECDYRETKVALAYNGKTFSVPKRLHIIGMMNTADRSLAMIDYALRRRFSFFEFEPGFDSEGFRNYQNALSNEMFDELISRVKELNIEITMDNSLGKGFCIGHSYFCGKDTCSEEWLKAIVDFDILPMLGEYWFDDSAKLQRWENKLHGVFQ